MMRSSLKLFAILIPMFFLITGCVAVGQAYDLAGVLLTLAASGSAAIAVTAIDRRGGGRPPFFAGTLRGGYGNPFDVKIRGKLPLAQVTAEVVVKGLAARGFQARSVALEDKADKTEIKAGLAAAEKRLLIDIEQWHSDTYMNVGMYYRLTAKVLDQTGKTVAESTVTGAEGGKDNLKGSFWNPAGYAKKAVPKAFRDQLERLLNAEAIVKALA